MKQYFKGIINLKGKIYKEITNSEKAINNRKIEPYNQQITFQNGFKLILTVSGFKSYRENDIYVPINIVYSLKLLDGSSNLLKEKEFNINDISRLLNFFSIIYDDTIYIIKIVNLDSKDSKNKGEFNENSMKEFVTKTRLINDDIVNMCCIVLKNLNSIKNDELVNIIINKIEKSNICNDNRENFKMTIASLLGNLVKKELTTTKHDKNINDMAEFYCQRYFNSVA